MEILPDHMKDAIISKVCKMKCNQHFLKFSKVLQEYHNLLWNFDDSRGFIAFSGQPAMNYRQEFINDKTFEKNWGITKDTDNVESIHNFRALLSGILIRNSGLPTRY